ncbi:general transcription factor IIH subunit 3-like [Ylistrum balloti]|uniref:general transcription factor IIH subunit 3-like n=1 Tax=Ylistrum balloti TaxID=509963 RepID=UPI002905C0B4|nr:general transcription factor IIH subunit 3-like [Ylistrum balloti]
MTESSVSSQLVIILDTNPVWWGQADSRDSGQNQLSLSQCLECLMVFANSHLMMSHRNKLAVIAAHTDKSIFLYPKKDQGEKSSINTADEASHSDGKYELFGLVNNQIKNQARELVINGGSSQLYPDTVLAGALAMALCYIHRSEKEVTPGEQLSSRILIIKGSEDNPEQYMNLMNAVFTAQKQNIVVDACVLDNDSGLLQQACDITGGIYLKIPQVAGLLQYLLWVFLPDPTERHKVNLPPKAQVDYRAACFCHRNLIDIGYVCSVCLSIHCSFSPICSTCHTTFKMFGPTKGLKRKSKKQPS